MAILSISSKYRTGALEIGHELQKILGYKFIRLGGRGGLLHEAKRIGQQMKLYGAKDGEASMECWGGNEFISFMGLVQSVIFDHAAKDNVIILSRAGNYLLKGIPHALGIRIMAPAEYRIERLMEKEGVSHETARLLVKQADREIDCTIYQLFGKGWDDPEAYEMAFDIRTQRHEEIIEIVRNLLISKDTLKTAESRDLLRLKALAARVKAKVAANQGFYASTLDMEIKGNGILLRGIVCGKVEQKKIEREAREIAGTVPLICELNCQTLKKKKTLPLVEG
ncbi:MAG: cytidylate kinase-like family protein [Deltaproteobacteria bacterium]|nr:cytidylate kinase-like family protein [Deltaproteobacteria bacterium]